jgi:DNA-binding HxlR family transcriptional regulator
MAATADGAGVPTPLLELVEVVARRHALGLLWALRGGPQPFRALALGVGAPEAAASQRLRELRTSGLVEVTDAGGYRLTSTGRRLQDVLEQAAAFADGWSRMGPRARTPRGAPARAPGEPAPDPSPFSD